MMQKKASESSSRSDLGKTHEDRCWNFKRFLTPLATGAMLATAGVGRTMADQSRALQNLSSGSDNSTGLTPAFPDQRTGNSPSERAVPALPEASLHPKGPTVEEIWPNLSKTIAEHFREQASKNTLQGEAQEKTSSEQRELKEGKGTEPLLSNEEKIATLKAVAEKAGKDPEFAARVRQMLAERRQLSEQNKETERLTPDKIDPEIWRSVRKMLTERRELNNNSGTTIVLVHGVAGWETGGSGNGVNCRGGYWGDAITFLKGQGYSDCRTVKFYTDDVNCDVDLHTSSYANPCSNFYPGSEGTNNEDLNHVSCLLAQFLYQNFGQSNQNVVLVGHSMGGIIIRNTMYLMQVNETPFPPSIGTVTDAVTFNSPHGGVPSVGGWAACLGCKQGTELTSGSDFMNSLGLYPQVPGGATSWTIVGSECDQFVSPVSAISMNANQAVVYSTRGKSDNTYDNTCYDHGGALHDGNVINNAIQYTCSTDDPVNSPCGTAYASTNGPWTVGQGPRGLQELYNAASS